MQGFGYIYKTTNLTNGRIYIGQKTGSFAPGYLGSGKIIVKSLLKHGRENFKLEVLAFGSTREMLDALVIKYIAEYRAVFGNEFLYNLSAGGVGVRMSCSDEKKEKLRQATIEQFSDSEFKEKWCKQNKDRCSISENNPMFGKHHTDETRKKIGEANSRPNLKLRGKAKTKEHREALVMAWKDRAPDSVETRERKRLSHLGKKHTPEEIQKMKEGWAKRRESLALALGGSK